MFSNRILGVLVLVALPAALGAQTRISTHGSGLLRDPVTLPPGVRRIFLHSVARAA